MASIAQITDLKAKVERLRQEKARAEGGLAQVLVRLQEEFGCKTIADAEALLKKTKAEEAKAEEAFTTAMEEFQEKWGESLE